jgi:hypothetical protein
VDPGPARRAAQAPDVVESLCGALGAVLAVPDAPAARALVSDSMLAPGPLYIDVLRPALSFALARTGWPVGDARRRLAVSTIESIVAQATPDWPTDPRCGRGRRAIVAHGSDGLAPLDAQVIADALEACGWSAGVVALASGLEDDAALVVVTGLAAGDMADLPRALAAAPPDVVVICQLDEPGQPTAGLAADIALGGPAGLLSLVAARPQPAAGEPWGVRLAKVGGDGFLIAPTGVLDGRNAGRLRAILDSRRAGLAHVTIDLRDLSAVDSDGLDVLDTWHVDASKDGIASIILRDSGTTPGIDPDAPPGTDAAA